VEISEETWQAYLEANPEFASLLMEPNSPQNNFSKQTRLQPWYQHTANHFGIPQA
jgi:hypothetical protein